MNQKRYAVMFYFILALLGLWLVLIFRHFFIQGELISSLFTVLCYAMYVYASFMIPKLVQQQFRLIERMHQAQQTPQTDQAFVIANRYKAFGEFFRGRNLILVWFIVAAIAIGFNIRAILFLFILEIAIGLYLLYHQHSLLQQLKPAMVKAVRLSQTELLLYAGFVLVSVSLLVLGQITLLWAMVGVFASALLGLVRWLKLQTWEIVDAHAAPVLSSSSKGV